jgi:hypothetical protein
MKTKNNRKDFTKALLVSTIVGVGTLGLIKYHDLVAPSDINLSWKRELIGASLDYQPSNTSPYILRKANAQVYVTINDSDEKTPDSKVLLYSGSVWKDHKYAVPSLLSLLSNEKAGIFKVEQPKTAEEATKVYLTELASTYLPQALLGKAKSLFTGHPEQVKVTLEYKVDTTNQLDETNESDNNLVVPLDQNRLEIIAAEIASQLNAARPKSEIKFNGPSKK